MLPDPEPGVDVEIVSDNLRALQAVYVAYQLEQLRMFQVGDRLVELFQQGLLPLGQGTADRLRRVAATDRRLTPAERARVYAQALGWPPSDPTAPGTNREFTTLWLRFVASTALFARQRDATPLLKKPAAATGAVLRRAAHALAANASAQGAGVAQAAKRLSAEVRAVQSLLQAPEVASAFGARDMWQVIEQVNRQYLGGAVNVHRYRTQAQSGAVVLKWLAAHAGSLGNNAAGPDLPFAEPRLVGAAQQWLAASVAQGDAPVPPFDLHALAQDLVQTLGPGAQAPNDGPAVFCGAAGSGKSLAAHVLAVALSRDLQRVDLNQLLGPYAGETEKNLDKLLARAERADAVLLFDEADALFGKRSEVKDAHDRYATVDTAQLLRRIEAHAGLVVLECKAAPAKRAFAARDRVIRFPRPHRR